MLQPQVGTESYIFTFKRLLFNGENHLYEMIRDQNNIVHLCVCKEEIRV